MNKQEFEDTITSHLSEISADMAGWGKLYNFLIEKLYQQRKDQFTSSIDLKSEQLEILKSKARQILQDISALVQFPALLEGKNNEYLDIQKQIQALENDLNNESRESSIDTILNEGKKFIENLGEIAGNTRNHEMLKVIFEFVFSRTPYYGEFISRTTPLRSILSLKINKNHTLADMECISKIDENLRWQPH